MTNTAAVTEAGTWMGIANATLTISRITSTEGRYEWTTTLTGTDLATDEPKTVTMTWHTNREAEGLWCGDQQIKGTAQYHHGRRANAVKAMREHFDSDTNGSI